MIELRNWHNSLYFGRTFSLDDSLGQSTEKKEELSVSQNSAEDESKGKIGQLIQNANGQLAGILSSCLSLEIDTIIDDPFFSDTTHVQVLEDKEYERRFGNKDDGICNTATDEIYLKNSLLSSREKFIATYTHEKFHLLSYRIVHMEGGEIQDIGVGLDSIQMKYPWLNEGLANYIHKHLLISPDSSESCRRFTPNGSSRFVNRIYPDNEDDYIETTKQGEAFYYAFRRLLHSAGISYEPFVRAMISPQIEEESSDGLEKLIPIKDSTFKLSDVMDKVGKELYGEGFRFYGDHRDALTGAIEEIDRFIGTN
jgi:hypothetical protein